MKVKLEEDHKNAIKKKEQEKNLFEKMQENIRG